MTKQEIQEIARNALRDIQDNPGYLLYSSHQTLRPGELYLLGFNPGGEEGEPILNSVEDLLRYDINAYTDECWSTGRRSYSKGQAPLQRRVTGLLQSLGKQPTEVCASNLIFQQSQYASDINYSLADKCWPVHEAIIKLVAPRMIITFGNSRISPFQYLIDKFNVKEYCSIPAKHGDWKVKGFWATIHARKTFIAGLPHLSRFDPLGKPDLVDWLKEKLGSA